MLVGRARKVLNRIFISCVWPALHARRTDFRRPKPGIAGSRQLNTSKQRKDEILKESFGSTRKRPRSNMYGLVYNFRATLNATGCYDEPEVERVAVVELTRPTESEIHPVRRSVADRLTRRFKAARERWLASPAVPQTRRDELRPRLHVPLPDLRLRRRRARKRAIFYTRLLSLVESDREREGAELFTGDSHPSTSANTGRRALALRSSEPVPAPPMCEAGQA